MSFNRFRPTSHFIAPHSWMNDPCGAVYVPEVQEYILCYQWHPGSTDGGNSAWGMARSKDLVTWRDSAPAIRSGSSYDALGVFSGSVVSRLIDGKRVLFLFYTSVAALPIHWSKPYLKDCESQSVAISTDFGFSWHRYQENPLLSNPPHRAETTGWRDPFVSQWKRLSALLGALEETNYMMLASGKRGHGPQLPLYKSDDLLEWSSLGFLLDFPSGKLISPTSNLRFGQNFECASFFSLGAQDYIIIGIEEDSKSTRHEGHFIAWLSGNLVLKEGKPQFEIRGHGLLDSGIAYAAHIFRDADDRLIQLGWINETTKARASKAQGWAGFLAHPRELCEVSRPISEEARSNDIWTINEESGTMTTLGVRPAPQVVSLRNSVGGSSLREFRNTKSTNYEVVATFRQLSRNETFIFNVRESPNDSEVTRIILDLKDREIVIDRSHSSLENLGTYTPDFGSFQLLPGEDLSVRFFVDGSVIEVYVNDRFAITSRIYPSLDTSVGVSYDFGVFDERYIKFEFWEGLKNAWPERQVGETVLEECHPLTDLQQRSVNSESLLTAVL